MRIPTAFRARRNSCWRSSARACVIASVVTSDCSRDTAALGTSHAECILAIDQAVAVAWGRSMAQRTRRVVDALIAATARVHNLTLVTRTVADFADCGVDAVDPWAA